MSNFKKTQAKITPTEGIKKNERDWAPVELYLFFARHVVFLHLFHHVSTWRIDSHVILTVQRIGKVKERIFI